MRDATNGLGIDPEYGFSLLEKSLICPRKRLIEHVVEDTNGVNQVQHVIGMRNNKGRRLCGDDQVIFAQV